MHQAPDQFKLSPGWQEPGLWRPRWIMDREFYEDIEEEEGNDVEVKGKGKDNSAHGKKLKRDRVFFKLKSDRTMKIYRSDNRPILEFFKKKKEGEKKKNLFESGTEEMASIEEQIQAGAAKLDESYYNIDGTWWWQDGAPLNQGKVKLETREGKEKVKYLHDVKCDWGVLDGYAAKFRRGKISKYKMTDNGVPLGTTPIGTFTIRVCPHRPLVSKDYVAFQ